MAQFKFYCRSEVGTIVPTTLAEKPVNPRTGKEYAKYTKAWWRWYYGLSQNDRNILSDMEAAERWYNCN